MTLFIFWIILSFVVAAIGDKRKIGFGGALLASLFLSPLIGIIIVGFSDKRDLKSEYVNRILEKANWALKKKNYQKAKELLKEVVGTNPNGSPHTCFKLAKIYSIENDREASIFYLKKAFSSGFSDLDLLRSAPELECLKNEEFYKKFLTDDHPTA